MQELRVKILGCLALALPRLDRNKNAAHQNDCVSYLQAATGGVNQASATLVEAGNPQNATNLPQPHASAQPEEPVNAEASGSPSLEPSSKIAKIDAESEKPPVTEPQDTPMPDANTVS